MDFLSYGVIEKNECIDEIDFVVESLQINGFATLESGYNKDFLAMLKTASEVYAQNYNEKYGSERVLKIGDSNTYRSPAISANIFIEVAQNPKVLTLCQRILKSGFYLNQQNLVINPPQGGKYSQLRFHRDLPYQHYVSSRPLAINTLLAVDDFTIENGATLVLGGTHKFEKYPTDEFIGINKKQIEVKAGTFLVLDCMTFHAASANCSQSNRIGLNHVYSTLMLRPQIDWNRAFTSSEKSAMAPDTKKLFGIDITIPGSVEEFISDRITKIES